MSKTYQQGYDEGYYTGYHRGYHFAREELRLFDTINDTSDEDQLDLYDHNDTYPYMKEAQDD